TEAIQCLWLYPPRRWIVSSESDERMSDQQYMGDAVNGVQGGQASRLDRLPPHGPRPPIAINDGSPPTFLILFADHRINLYFPSMHTWTTRPGELEADRNLRLLSS